GDLWSGSEGGIIKIWPWEATEKSLSLTLEERHMAGLLIERSYIDLRSQVTVNGNCCNIFAADVKYMFSDHSDQKFECRIFVICVVVSIQSGYCPLKD
ncbi:unnamed protein product, partial [Ilex paraguariensis]